MVAVMKDAVTGTVTPRHSAVEVLRYAAAVQPPPPPPPPRAVHGDSGGREDTAPAPAPGHQGGQAASSPVAAVGGKVGPPSGGSSAGIRRDRKGRISLDDLFKQANRLSQLHKPHKANDAGWEAVEKVRARDGDLGLNHFKLLKRLGCGDIGNVYLAELRDTKFRFAMKVMDLGSLASRRKQMRAETERDILSILDHPFLPTLYAHFETPQFLCLVMEYCAGGDLHTLRQKQDGRFFSCEAARFYAAEVLLGLEYLHMMGVVYRDLKPENVLVRGDGHVMLSDFDLSLKCSVSPTLLTQGSTNHNRSSSTMRSRGRDTGAGAGGRDETKDDAGSCYNPVSCLPRRGGGGGSGVSWWEAACVTSKQSNNNKNNNGLTSQWSAASGSNVTLEAKVPSSRWRTGRLKKTVSLDQVVPLPQLVAEPMGVRSMSFVGTHEYLAPEIISGDGHGSPVDWWTFGIFLFELLYGKTPFKGEENEITLVNVLAQPLEFPPKGDPYHREIDSSAQELIKALLVKDPQKRLGSNRGASEVKRHPFFQGINWALIRCTVPPQIPRPPGQTPKMKHKQQTKDHLRDIPSTPVAAAAASKPQQQSDSTPPPPTPTPSRGLHQQHKTKNYDMVGDSRDRSTSRFEYF